MIQISQVKQCLTLSGILTLHAEQFLKLSVYLINNFPGLYTPGSENAVKMYIKLTQTVNITDAALTI